MNERIIRAGRSVDGEWRVIEDDRGDYYHQRIFHDRDGVKRWEVVPLDPADVWQVVPEEEPLWRREARRIESERRRRERSWWFRVLRRAGLVTPT